MSVDTDAFIRHAQLFGIECVFETADSNGFSGRELALLRVELDAIERGRKAGRYTVGSRRRRSPEETVQAVRLLRDRGLVVGAIAVKLDVSNGYVSKCLRKPETVKNRAAKPHG